MKKADKSGARIAVVIGEREIETQSAGVKLLRAGDGQGEQRDVPFVNLAASIAELTDQEVG
jgi:histidyl-tRNA synthetase